MHKKNGRDQIVVYLMHKLFLNFIFSNVLCFLVV